MARETAQLAPALRDGASQLRQVVCEGRRWLTDAIATVADDLGRYPVGSSGA